MGDLKKNHKPGGRIGDPGDRAEYASLLKRYRDEEEAAHRHRLLYLGEAFGAPPETSR